MAPTPDLRATLLAAWRTNNRVTIHLVGNLTDQREDAIDEQVRIVASAIASLDERDFPGSVVVVEPGRVRLRRRK